MPLNQAEGGTINARIAEIEARTGVRVTTMIVAKSDAYAELPWKAFALGSSLAAFATVLANGWGQQWTVQGAALLDAIAILGVGATSALAAVWVPAWARLFLSPARRDVEVRQYAQAAFLTRELFRTPQRTGLLILVSRFERKIQLLPDTGFRERVTASDWHTVIGRMTPPLRASRPSRALQEGLLALEDLLVRKDFVATSRIDCEAPE